MRKLYLLGLLMLFVWVAAPTANADEGPKVLVCKYVGAPGVDERLKEGKNPIEVAKPSTSEGWFNDKHGRSYVLPAGETVCPPADGGVDPTPSPGPTFDIGEPACGPIDSCGEVPEFAETTYQTPGQCADDLDGTYRYFEVTEYANGDPETWVAVDTFDPECVAHNETVTVPETVTTPAPEPVELAPAAVPAPATTNQISFTG